MFSSPRSAVPSLPSLPACLRDRDAENDVIDEVAIATTPERHTFQLCYSGPGGLRERLAPKYKQIGPQPHCPALDASVNFALQKTRCTHWFGAGRVRHRLPLSFGKIGPGGKGLRGPVTGPRECKNLGRGPSEGSSGRLGEEGAARSSCAWCGPGTSFPNPDPASRGLVCKMGTAIPTSQAYGEGYTK